jgi:integrase
VIPPVPHDGMQTPPQSSVSVAEALHAIGAALQSLAASLSGGQPVPPPRPSLSTGPTDPMGLSRAVNEFLTYQARLARSDRYLRQLRTVFGSLAKGRGNLMVHELTPAEVRRWSESGRWSQGTRRRYVSDLRGFMDWCRRRGWCASNPAEDVRIPRMIDTRAPSIHTPAEVSKILECSRGNLDVTRHLAVRYFAGLRTAEAMALREEDVRQEEGIIVVPARVAKTRRRRVVAIAPNLAQWLALGGTLRGMRPDTIRQVTRLAGVTCPPNVSRHSWCSHHLALHESAAKTALEAGHAEAMLFAHYRALVSKAQAVAYFGLAPSAGGGSTASSSAGIVIP